MLIPIKCPYPCALEIYKSSHRIKNAKDLMDNYNRIDRFEMFEHFGERIRRQIPYFKSLNRTGK